MEHSYGTVADFLRSHPDATLDMMTPGGFVLLTPELGAGLLRAGRYPPIRAAPGVNLSARWKPTSSCVRHFLSSRRTKKIRPASTP